MNSMQKKQDDIVSGKLTGMTDQLTVMTHQYEQVVLDLDDLKGKYGDLHTQHQHLNQEYKALCVREEEQRDHISVLNQGSHVSS